MIDTPTDNTTTAPASLADLLDDHDGRWPDDDTLAAWIDGLAPHEVHRALATLDLMDAAATAHRTGGDPAVAVATWLQDHATPAH